MRRSLHLLFSLLLLAGCAPPLAGSSPRPDATPMAIRQGTVYFDQIISGELCDGSWSGLIYVEKGIGVRPWDQDPLFLQSCDLTIAPGTVVYVGDHNDDPYYRGCSCHFVKEDHR